MIRRLSLAVVVVTSAVLLLYAYMFGRAATGGARPFHEPTKFDVVLMVILAAFGIALQFVSVYLLRTRKQSVLRQALADWKELSGKFLISAVATLIVAVVLFWVLLAISGI